MNRRPLPPCLRCQATVLWAKTERGKWIALDPKPDPKGNQAAWQDSDGTWKTRQLSPKSDPPWGWERIYMPHLTTTTCKPQPAVTPARPANVTPITGRPLPAGRQENPGRTPGQPEEVTRCSMTTRLRPG